MYCVCIVYITFCLYAYVCMRVSCVFFPVLYCYRNFSMNKVDYRNVSVHAEHKSCDCRIKGSLEKAGALIAQLVSTALYGMSSSKALAVVSVCSSLVIMWLSYRLHYISCLSVCPVWAHNSKTKKMFKNQNWCKHSQDTSNRAATAWKIWKNQRI